MNYLVYDIGSAKIRYAIMDGNYEILERGSQAIVIQTRDGIQSQLKDIYQKYALVVSGVAVSMPGRINVYTGQAYTAGVISYLENVNMASLFHEFVDVPVSIENDGKCATLAEAWYGTLRDKQDGIVMIVRNGIAGGIVKDGNLHRGKRFGAGEFSYWLNQTDRGVDLFGRVGNLNHLYRLIEKRKQMDKNSLTFDQVRELYLQGDRDVLVSLEELCDALIPYLYNIHYIYDPSVIALGGELITLPGFVEMLQNRMQLFAKELPFDFTLPSVSACHFGNEAYLIGALINYRANNIKPVGDVL